MSIESVIKSIEQSYGSGSIMTLGSRPKLDVEVIPTGCLSIDIGTDVGGFPKGRIVEIYGPEGTGKTTLCMHAIKEAQAMGELCAFVDAEHAMDVRYAENIGIDIDSLLISQPDSGEQALQIVESLVNSGEVGFIVVDSAAALVPRAEIDGEIGDQFIGLQARLMSQAMRKLTGVVAKSNVCLVFTNQIRDKIGPSMPGADTTTSSCGKALKFYASMRIEVKYIGQIKNKQEAIIGRKIRMKIVKNKVGVPFKEIEYDIIYGIGIDIVGDLLDHGSELDVVTKSGAWYSYSGERIGQGRPQAVDFLTLNPDILDTIREQIKVKLNPIDESE